VDAPEVIGASQEFRKVLGDAELVANFDPRRNWHRQRSYRARDSRLEPAPECTIRGSELCGVHVRSMCCHLNFPRWFWE
jgi:hypothetical protein